MRRVCDPQGCVNSRAAMVFEFDQPIFKLLSRLLFKIEIPKSSTCLS